MLNFIQMIRLKMIQTGQKLFFMPSKKTKCRWIVTIKMLERQEKTHQKIYFFTIKKLGEN